MEEKSRTQEELSLAEIFRILLRKAKLLIVVLLAGIIVGAGIGILQTRNINYYGTSMEFYVNPYVLAKPSEDADGDDEKDKQQSSSQYGVYGAYGRPVMDNMVRLLSSDVFAEKICLDGDGLPHESFLSAFKLDVQSVNFLIDTARASVKAAKDADETTKESATKKADADVKAAVEAWRNTSHYLSCIRLVKSATEYNYYEGDASDVDSLAKSFIYVNIQVLNNENFAAWLFNKMKTTVTEYVVENMAVPTGYDGTNCQFISTASTVHLLNPNDMQETAIKYALLLGAAALVIACVVVIIVYHSDKRLRNFELTMERFGVPVLGVIPSIENESAKKTKTGVTKQ